MVDDIIDESNPFQNLVTEEIWIEDDIFDDKDNPDTVDTSKDILKGIKENDPFLDFNVSNEAIIDDLFESSGDDEDITTDDNEPEFMKAKPAISEDEISLSDTNVVSTDTGPKQSKKFITTRMKAAVRAAEKVKKKYKRQRNKKIGQLNKIKNKASTDWLKKAGYLDTEDLDAISYDYIKNKEKTEPKQDTVG